MKLRQTNRMVVSGAAALGICWSPCVTLASGPLMPDALLSQGGQEAVWAPEFFYLTELRALAAEYKDFDRAYRPAAGNGNELTAKADEADFAKALAERRIQPGDPPLATRQHLAARAFLNAEPPQPGPLPASFESEFRDYHEGALAYRRKDLPAARAAFKKLLDRPAEQRHFRTVWAHYMLARIEADESHPDEAVKSCRALRQSVRDGFSDPTDCYSASLRIEAVFNDELGWRLRLQHLATDPDSMNADHPIGTLLQAYDDAELARRAASPVLRAVTSCELMSGASCYGYQAENAAAACKRWLDAIEKAGVREAGDADRLGWIAYLAGDYPRAGKWLKLQQKSTPLSLWLQAKMDLRAGRPAAALTAMKSAMPMLGKGPRLEVPAYIPTPFVTPRDAAWADQALLLMASGRFRETMDAFLTGGHWQDAAWVAERLMTTDELKTYVDKSRPWNAEREKAAMDFERDGNRGERIFATCLTNWTAMADTSEDYLTLRLRWLLARRLMREGRLTESIPYFPEWQRGEAETYRTTLRNARDTKRSRGNRAGDWWQAAWLARTRGLELMGTEREPDNAVWGGQYEAPATRGIRLKGKITESRGTWDHPEPDAEVPLLLPVSAFERKRLLAIEQPHTLRWHYRITATIYAWRAALLMPDGTEELADVLNSAGRWLRQTEGGDQLSKKFYDAIEARCADTELGRKVLARKNFTDDLGPLSGKAVESEQQTPDADER